MQPIKPAETGDNGHAWALHARGLGVTNFPVTKSWQKCFGGVGTLFPGYGVIFFWEAASTSFHQLLGSYQNR
jgi:hypothetical protein